jgi:hypothetical protein
MSNCESWDEIADSHKEKSLKFMELLPDTEDLTLITLKGHLIVEEILYFIVLKHCTFPKYLDEARLSFAQLTNLAKAMINIPLHECAFPAISKLNKLRNNLAHNIESEKAEALAKEFISLCKTTNADGKTIPQQVKSSICYILGSLSAIGTVSEIMKEMPNKPLKQDK